MFLPVKIYPAVFLASAAWFYLESKTLLKHLWVWFLLIFTVYATVVFLTDPPEDTFALTNFLKIPVNFSFLYIAAGWISSRSNEHLLRRLDITLHIAFIFTLFQLLLYHQSADFSLIAGSPSSAKASALYNPAWYFWGLDDKNMFGARIALLGFAYILLPVVQRHHLSWWRIGAIFLLAWLSLSRTPLVALLLGVFCLLWAASAIRVRVALALLTALALPFVAQKVIRIDTITASNDGMGVRLVYWKSFFRHFQDISPLGNGFMSGKDFLNRHAAFYHGEPHIHNTFLSNYLDFGIIGFFSYTLFLIFFYRFCREQLPGNGVFRMIAFLPLLAIMMILYSGYDNDIMIYLLLVLLLGTVQQVHFNALTWRNKQ